MKRFWNFIKDENGLETVEYAVITGLIVLGTILVVSAIGTKVTAIFQSLDDTLGTVPAAAP